jgi:LysM repeat protein
MRNIRQSIFLFFLAISVSSSAQNATVVHDYINSYKELAIAEMKRTGVPASITLAQGIHESGAGKSQLVLESNNHFGIKCKTNWTGETVRHDDDAKGECFRKYPRADDSYRDHSDFLKSGQRYSFLFQLDPRDYAGWAKGLKKAGYATNPKYPQVLIDLVEAYGLQEYTLMALENEQDKGNVVAKTDQPETEVKYAEAVPPVEVPAEEIERERKEAEPKINKYPGYQFLINETKVVYAKKRTSFLTIAKQYNVDLFRLFEFNEIEEAEETATDQLVYLQRKRKTGADEFHIVQPGETLHVIAQLQGIRLESLCELNWLKENDRPAPGQQLSLRKKAATMPKLTVKENDPLPTGLPKN